MNVTEVISSRQMPLGRREFLTRRDDEMDPLVTKRSFGLVDKMERTIGNVMPRMEESTGQKIFLPCRPNEPRFAPQQYYYPASKSGVVPSG